MYFSEIEPFFCLTGSELDREAPELRDGRLTSAEDNNIHLKITHSSLLVPV